jgi:glycosyltransferase involved in cell wall biosynthesis
LRVTFVITNLDSGGAERVISIMANHWAQAGWPVTLLTFDEASAPPFYDLDSRIRLVPLGIYRASSNPAAAVASNLKRIKALRRAIRDSEPDVVISFLTFVNSLVLLATRGLGVPVVVSERNEPQMDPIGPAWKWLRRCTYSFATRLVTQTERGRESFPPAIQARTTVIPNPVPRFQPVDRATPSFTLARPALVSMGSFHPKKGFDLLLRAFARLKDRHPDWMLTIIGDGPLRTQIESLRDALGLKDRVHLPGRVKTPNHVLMQADLFVLSSRWEGWPMALAEAMACGLPVIATDCRTGPREMIHHGVDGLLVPPEDVDALEDAMDSLMADESKRKQLASRAVEVAERFEPHKVMGMWEELLRRELHEG